MTLLEAAKAAAGPGYDGDILQSIYDGRVSVNGAIYTYPEFNVAPGALVRFSAPDWSRVYIVPLP